MRLTAYLQIFSLLALLSAITAFNLLYYGLHRYPAPTQVPVWAVPGAQPERGAAAIRRHGCGACHIISGIGGANGWVGPPLDDIKQRTFIGGMLPNTPSNMIEWIQHPRTVNPQTAMPDLGVTSDEARDIAAYLYWQGP